MDTNVSQQSWLVLIPRLPGKPDYLRVKLQRRMQRIGALPLKNGVYVLPLTPETSVASELLRAELRREASELVVFGAVVCAGVSDSELVRQFRESSDGGYARVVAAADTARTLSTRDQRRLALSRAQGQLDAVKGVDYFRADGRSAATRALARLEHSLAREA